MVLLQISLDGFGWIVGIVATLLAIVGSITKLFADNRASMKEQIKNDQIIKSKIFQSDVEITRIKEDMMKVESRLLEDNKGLTAMLVKMEEKIDHKLDSLQKTIMDYLKK
jgi:hypothetical protein